MGKIIILPEIMFEILAIICILILVHINGDKLPICIHIKNELIYWINYDRKYK